MAEVSSIGPGTAKVPMHNGDVIIRKFNNSEHMFYSLGRLFEIIYNPTFAGILFTHGEFNKHWVNEYEKPYFENLLGISLDGASICKSLQYLKNHQSLHPEEYQIQNCLEHLNYINDNRLKFDDFYFIGLNNSHQSIEVLRHSLVHELSHALYHLDFDYQKYTHKLWEHIKSAERKRYSHYLSQKYIPEYFQSETAAQFVASDGSGQNPPIQSVYYHTLIELFYSKISEQAIDAIISELTGNQL